MPEKFHKIGLIGKHGDATPQETLVKLSRYLLDLGHDLLLEEDTALRLTGLPLNRATLDEIGGSCDLAIVVGGMVRCCTAPAPSPTTTSRCSELTWGALAF